MELGESGTGAAVRAGSARIVVLAADASENAEKRAAGYLAGRRALLVRLPYTKHGRMYGLRAVGSVFEGDG